VPVLEGCYSQGETLEEVNNNIKEAVVSYIAVLKEEGKEIPKDKVMILSRIAV
jgi:predicted RNase H-like HicB family nuclease